MPTTQQLITASDALDISDPDRFVSSLSRWTYPQWRLDSVRRGASHNGEAIYWPQDVDERIVHQLKALVWCLMVAPDGFKAVDPCSAAALSPSLCLLARYMGNKDYMDLGEFGPNDAQHLATNLRDLAEWLDQNDPSILDEDEGDAAPLAAESTKLSPSLHPGLAWLGRGSLSFGVVRGVGKLLRRAFQQRRILARLGIPAPKTDPLNEISIEKWAAEIRPSNYDDEKIVPLPPEIYIPLMHAAFGRLGPAANELLTLQERFIVLRHHSDAGPDARARAIRALLRDFEFASPLETEQAWVPSLVDDEKSRLSVKLRNLLTDLRTAVVLVLAQSTGMRLGEIVAIQGGLNPDTGLPACIRKTPSPSGLLDLFYVSSVVKKGHSAPDPAEWLVGSVPTGSNELPLAVRAIQIAERLFAPWRALADDDVAQTALMVAFQSAYLPTTTGGVGRLTTHRASRSLSNLYGELLDWDSIPDITSLGESLISFKQTRGRVIQWRRWRKTFAVAVINTDSRLLPALRRHFKHIYLATTERAYVGCDPVLLEDRDEIALQESMRFLRERAHANEGPKATVGRLVERGLDLLRDRILNGGADGEETFEGAMKLHGTTLWLAPHGACGIRFVPELAACHRAAGTVSFLNDKPSFRHRSPDLCAGCQCFIAGPPNLQYWRTRWLSNAASKREARRAGLEASSEAFGHRAAGAYRIWRILRRPPGEKPTR